MKAPASVAMIQLPSHQVAAVPQQFLLQQQPLGVHTGPTSMPTSLSTVGATSLSNQYVPSSVMSSTNGTVIAGTIMSS